MLGRCTLVASLALALVFASRSEAARPVFFSAPATRVVAVDSSQAPAPPAVPHVGHRLWGDNGGVTCDPSCDPRSPDAAQKPGQTFLGGQGPVGQTYEFYRRTQAGYVLVRPRSPDNTYVVQPADAGSQILLKVYATNFDCAYPRSDGYQECRYSTTSADAPLTPLVDSAPVPTAPAAAPSAPPPASPGGVGSIPASEVTDKLVISAPTVTSCGHRIAFRIADARGRPVRDAVVRISDRARALRPQTRATDIGGSASFMVAARKARTFLLVVLAAPPAGSPAPWVAALRRVSVAYRVSCRS